jgi:signal transduction histidine kinase/ActR/RegA family two-component response regulator
MRLSTRLLLLVFLCLLPVIGVETLTQLELRARRTPEFGDLALHQAELWNGNLESIVEGARQLTVAIAQFPSVRALDSGCGTELQGLQASLSAYRFLAVFGADGHLVCGSVPGLGEPLGAGVAWLQDAMEARRFRVGRYAAGEGLAGPFLPFFQPVQGSGKEPGVVVAGLDLSWLAEQIAEMRARSAQVLSNSTLIETDRDGTILYRFPEPEQWVGRPLPADLASLIHTGHPGIANVSGRDGKQRVVGYIPTEAEPQDLFLASGFYASDGTADLDAASRRGALLIACSVLLALAIAWLVGRGSIGLPTKRLLEAARRWREGDLTARAGIGNARSEFGQLALAFNAMAAALQAREEERAQQAQLLEARVAERTRALSETNNRLQVEVGERERTEVALQQAQKLQAVGQLAGGIAHDFNNLLATVLGNLELIERRLLPTDNKVQPLVERAIGAVQRGAKLTSRLLAFSRRQRLTIGPTDLNQIVAELANLAESTLGRRVQIVRELAPDLWPALVDRSQMEAAILNLALNARDAMLKGGRLTISTANETIPVGTGSIDPSPGDYVRVTVADTGTGMTPEVQKRAFEPFYTTKGPGGSGLGLSQVYGMARQSGGTVRIVSQPGCGTEVSLLLPRAQPELVADPEIADGPARRQSSSPLVLLVDDDHAVRQVTSEMLRDLGCQVIEAAGGPEALPILEEQGSAFNLLVLDYAMPEMTGLHLATLARKRGITAPIILATGYAELTDPSEGSETILSAILRKPFTLRQLQQTVARARTDHVGADSPATV